MGEEIVNYVKEYRLKKEITQADLAKAMDVSRQSIISIENGRYIPSLLLAMKMAEYFGCAVEDLFKRKGM